MGDAVLSDAGDEASKISERLREEEGYERGTPPPNLKDGSCASGLGLCGIEVVLKPFVLAKEGLNGFDLLLSWGSCMLVSSIGGGLEDRGVKQSLKKGSVGVCSGVGDCSSKLYDDRDL